MPANGYESDDESIYSKQLLDNGRNPALAGVGGEAKVGQFSNKNCPNVIVEEDLCLDLYGLDSITVEQLFKRETNETFIKEIFPNFLLADLFRMGIFSAKDVKDFETERLRLGDDTDPLIRETLLTEQSRFLYKKLIGKIFDKPKILLKIIEILQSWYPDMADRLRRSLRDERDKLTLTDSRVCNNNHNNNCGSLTPMTTSHKQPSSQHAKRADKLVNIPDQISYFIERKAKQNEIVTHLKEMASRGKGWLVLHGMGGSGKSVLAASCVRKVGSSSKESEQLFPDGIFWLNIGQLNCASSGTDTLDKSLLLLKFELLSESIGYLYQKNEKKIDDLEMGKLRFCEHFKQKPRSLLVLDDVWSPKVVRYFCFDIPVLVTTRGCNNIPNDLCHIVQVRMQSGSGDILTMDESLCLLQLCLRNSSGVYCDLSQIDFAKQIVEHLNGLPFCMPHIANFMQRFYEDVRQTDDTRSYMIEKWQELYRAIVLENDHTTGTSNPSQTNFNLSVDNLVKKSIAALDENLISYLHDFAIFSENVPFSVLSTLWQRKDMDTMYILDQLVSKSLVIKNSLHLSSRRTSAGIMMEDDDDDDSTESSNIPINTVYGVHSITRNFLEQQLDPDNLKSRHARLVSNYLSRIDRTSLTKLSTPATSAYDFSLLADDHYIYQHLSYHLSSAGLHNLFPLIFLDLCFIRNKIAFVGPSDVLSEYQYYQEYFPKNQTQKLKDYQHFIASNSSQLAEPNIDFVQIALCEPDNSSVFLDTKSLLKSLNMSDSIHPHDMYFYFEWSNKNNSFIQQPPKVISFRCLPEARYASLSSDSRFICSVSGTQLQLLNGQTGEILENFPNAHLMNINHCVFSRDGKFVLTSSKDGTAKLWQTLLYDENGSQLTKSRSNSATLPISAVYDQVDSIVAGTNGRNSEQPEQTINGSSSFGTRRRRSSGNPRSAFKIFDYNFNKSKSEIGGSNSIKCGDISDDSRFIITGYYNGTLDLWAVSNAKPLYKMECPVEQEHIDLDDRRPVSCCSFSRDSSFVLALIQQVCYVFSITFRQNASGKKVLLPQFSRTQSNGAIKSPNSPVPVAVDLHTKLKHSKMAHNAVFGSGSSKHYPSIFTSRGEFIFEWQLKRHSRTFFFSEPNLLNDQEHVHHRYFLRNLSNYSAYLSICAVSASGQRIAGFETTRSEIFLWKRGTSIPFCSLRCQSINVVALCFSSDDERLLGCFKSGEITVWEIGQNYSVTSIVDLKNEFSTTISVPKNCRKNSWKKLGGKIFTKQQQIQQHQSLTQTVSNLNPSLNVLTIDVKGFLRMFKGYAGDEDKQFNVELKKLFGDYLQAKTNSQKNNSPKSFDPLLLHDDLSPKFNITCCDICAEGYIAIGTDCGEVFLYDISIAGEFKLFAAQHHSENESIFNCKFVSKSLISTNSLCQFVAASNRAICFFEFVVCENLKSLRLIEEKIIKLEEFMKFCYSGQDRSSVSIDGLTFVPDSSLIVFWTKSGHMFTIDYCSYSQQTESLMRSLIDSWNLRSTVSSYDFNVQNDLGEICMIVTTCDKYMTIFGIISDPAHLQMSLHQKYPIDNVSRCCRLSRTMSFFVLGYDSGTVALIRNRCRIWSQKAHSNWVYDLAISPDEQYILSASDSIKLWNQRGDLLQTFVTVGTVTRLFANFDTARTSFVDSTAAVTAITPQSFADSATSTSTSYEALDDDLQYIDQDDDDEQDDLGSLERLNLAELGCNSDENNNDRSDSRVSRNSYDSNPESFRQPANLTVVTVTDASSLYILRTFDPNLN